MNFRNIKIFFILLLLLINTYLLYNFVASDKNSMKIDSSTLNDIVSILQNNGISVDPAIIPTTYPDADIIESDFDAKYYDNLASAISLSERASINIMPDNSFRLVMRNDNLFYLNRRFGFEFSAQESTYEQAEVLEELYLSNEYYPADLTRDEKKLIESFLYPEAIAESHAPFSYEILNTYSDSKSKIALVSQTIDNVYIREHNMYIELENGKINRASGTWFFPQNSENYSADLYDQLSVLFAELDYNKNSTPTQANSDTLDTDNSSDEISNKYSITDIDFTYCIYWNSAQDGLFFIPAWKLSTDAGETRYYNAVNCKLYE